MRFLFEHRLIDGELQKSSNSKSACYTLQNNSKILPKTGAENGWKGRCKGRSEIPERTGSDRPFTVTGSISDID